MKKFIKGLLTVGILVLISTGVNASKGEDSTPFPVPLSLSLIHI